MTIMEQAKAILIEMDEIGGENDMPLEPAQQDDADLPQTAPTSPVADQTSSALIPFLLRGVAAKPELNQADGIHPNSAGYKIVAKNAWQVLEPILQKRELQRTNSTQGSN